MSDTLAIVMAAGKGTRMESDLPKVLVPACGRPMIEYVIDALNEALQMLIHQKYQSLMWEQPLTHSTHE